MFVRIMFHGGPLHEQFGVSETLDAVKVFFNERDRLVMVYRNEGDGAYLFSPDLSQGLTDIYDAAFAKFGGGSTSVFFPETTEEPLEDAAPAPVPEEELWKPSEPEQFLPTTEWRPDSDTPAPSPTPPSDESPPSPD